MNIAIPNIPTRRTTQNTSSQTSARLSGLSRGLLSLALVSLISACSTTAPSRQGKYKGKTPQNVSVAAGPNRDVAVYAMQFLGTPYRYGGSSPSEGFDCSGLVQYASKKSLNLNLPRRTSEQASYGTPISFGNLKAGDLLFFNISGQANSHVGIYLGQTYFVHAPSSGGAVRVEDYTLDYWQRRFSGARRIR